MAEPTPAAINLLNHRISQAHQAASSNDETRARAQLQALATEASIMAKAIPFQVNLNTDND